jgi:hypothetical protein
MKLPTKAQVDAASRHAITAAGVAVTIFGLQAKGVSMDQASAVIKSLGETVNTLVQLIAAIGVVYGGIVAARSASAINQAKSVAATGAQVIASPELAAATPDVPNIVSSDDVVVVPTSVSK